MKSAEQIKHLAIQTLQIESDSIRNITRFINNDFVESVRLIYETKGRIIVTGIGKSAIIANKIVATFNSTGTPAAFMHAGDAIHGDLGTISKDDIVLCISKSGSTPEIKVLVPLLRNSGNKLLAFTSDTESYLAKNADFVMNTYVEKEACPHNLAPTSSSAVQMAMGDALAVCLLDYRGFTRQDFARFHPGGSLGKRLYLRVKDIYHKVDPPVVNSDANIKDVIFEISSKRLGATAVIVKGKMVGVITDGDLRRMLERVGSFDNVKASDIMSQNPKTIDIDDLAVDALQKMKQHNITQLVVMKKEKYSGIIHLHDLLREGII